MQFPTCKWVLIYDADEEASESFRNNIRDFLKGLDKSVNTVYLPTISYLDIDLTKTEIASTPRILEEEPFHTKMLFTTKLSTNQK